MKKETMLLSDALKSAIEANKKIIVLKRIICVLIITNVVTLILGAMR